VNTVRDSTAAAYEAYRNDVYAWAYRLLGRHHDALDVVQDVFLRWNDQCSAETPANARGWLRRVTLNRAIDIHRGQMSRKTAGIESELFDPKSVAQVGDHLDDSQLRHDVSSALDTLTDMQRNVLVAKVYDSLTFSEIADELGISGSTAKTHYLRALRAVRRRLAPRWALENSP
jgi:RNA polymerase sigma-70 factor (ECF subfamily)